MGRKLSFHSKIVWDEYVVSANGVSTVYKVDPRLVPKQVGTVLPETNQLREVDLVGRFLLESDDIYLKANTRIVDSIDLTDTNFTDWLDNKKFTIVDNAVVVTTV